MKKKIPVSGWVGVFALLACAQAVAAVDPSDLKVTGTIKTPVCTVNAGDNNGTYDYGKISTTLIKPGTTHTPLTKQTQTWTVDCNADTYITYTPIDNEHDSVSNPGTSSFGLGYINETGKIGYYSVKMSGGKVDGVDVQMMFADKGATYGTSQATSTLNLGTIFSWTSDNGTRSYPKAGKLFVMDVAVEPFLAGSTTMNGSVKESVPLHGSVTLNYAFGI